MQNKKKYVGEFDHFANFVNFYEFSGFPAKIVRPKSSQRNDSDG